MHFKNIDNLISSEIGNAFSSAVLSVGIKDKIYMQKAYGEANIDTLFDIASLTKIVCTSMIAFKFIEDGKIRLYDTIDKFIETVPEDKKQITIKHLLTHTSGLEPTIFIEEKTSESTLKAASDVILSLNLLHPIGTKPVYSCLGFILLAHIFEIISNTQFDVLAKQYVTAPLALSNTSFTPSGDIAPTEKMDNSEEFYKGIVHDHNARFLNGVSGNAGIFSNIQDMTTFAQMLAMGGKTLNGEHYLSPAMLKKAIKNYTPGENQEFRGLGFNLAGSPLNFIGDLMGENSFGHTGFTGTSIAIDPDTGLFVVLLTNRVHPTRDNIRIIRMRSLMHNMAAAEASRMLAENN